MLINKIPKKLCEPHMDQEKSPTRVEYKPLGIPEEEPEQIRTMLEKKEPMWLGNLGSTNITEQDIDLISDTRP